MNRADKHICKCKNDFQDKEHGKQMRVCTPTKEKNTTTQVIRCTVCKTLHTINK